MNTTTKLRLIALPTAQVSSAIIFRKSHLSMKWELVFALPNLSLRDSIGNENIAIVRNDDSRIEEICSENIVSKIFIEGFRDQFKRDVAPLFLIIPTNAPGFIKDIETIVSFRNILALRYPENENCPQCSFWANRDRFTDELKE